MASAINRRGAAGWTPRILQPYFDLGKPFGTASVANMWLVFAESVCGRAVLRLNWMISDAGLATLVVGRLSQLAGYLYCEGLRFPERRGVDVETVGATGDLVGLRARADPGG